MGTKKRAFLLTFYYVSTTDEVLLAHFADHSD